MGSDIEREYKINVRDQLRFVDWLKDNGLYNPYADAKTMVWAQLIYEKAKTTTD